MKNIEATVPKLNRIRNPLEILADANENHYEKALEIVLQDENQHGVLIILTPQSVTKTVKIAKKIVSIAHKYNKPILSSLMGGEIVEKGEEILIKNRIPTFKFPNQAVKVFNYMWNYSFSLRNLYETPLLIEENDYEYLNIVNLMNELEENFLPKKSEEDEIVMKENEVDKFLS